MRTTALLLLLLGVGCGVDATTALDSPPDSATANPDAGVTLTSLRADATIENIGCSGLDERACEAAASRGCRAIRCGAFCGAPSNTPITYAGCAGPGEPGPACASGGAKEAPRDPPTGGACPDCSRFTDEASCLNSGLGCVSDSCTACDGLSRHVGCRYPNEAVTPCPPLACPADPCESLSPVECDASPLCHAVYQISSGCGCSGPGCCLGFSHCALGDRAVCADVNVTCRALPPECPTGFVVSYTENCYEGCVRPADCR